MADATTTSADTTVIGIKAQPTIPNATSAQTASQAAIQNFNTTVAATKARKSTPTTATPSTPTTTTPDDTTKSDEDEKPSDKPAQRGNDLIAGNNNEHTLVDSINDSISKINVSAGLGVAVFVLIFLLWLLVPTASGYTRAQLLWFTVMGQTKLTTETNISNQGQIPDSQIIDTTPPDTGNQTIVETSGPAITSNVDLSMLDYAGF